MPQESGILTIIAERGGTISEVTQFLSDLENAYLSLYMIDRYWPSVAVMERLSY